MTGSNTGKVSKALSLMLLLSFQAAPAADKYEPIVLPKVPASANLPKPKVTVCPPSDFFYYLNALQNAVDRHKRKMRRHGQSRCVVAFQVVSDGTFSAVCIKRSSGAAAYDNECLKVIKKTSGFRKMPMAVEQPVEVEYTFDPHHPVEKK